MLPKSKLNDPFFILTCRQGSYNAFYGNRFRPFTTGGDALPYTEIDFDSRRVLYIINEKNMRINVDKQRKLELDNDTILP